MIYHGKEKENHRGSHVKYCHCGKWHEGTLLEPVNYQFVGVPLVLVVLGLDNGLIGAEDVVDARMKVANGNYTEDDLKLLMQYLIPANHVTEVESVEITDADDITQEEADKIIEQLLKERENDTRRENSEGPGIVYEESPGECIGSTENEWSGGREDHLPDCKELAQ